MKEFIRCFNLLPLALKVLAVIAFIISFIPVLYVLMGGA
jgi:hypothetical protein